MSPDMALALEALGWSEADHWMRMRASYDLAQARMAHGWEARAVEAVR